MRYNLTHQELTELVQGDHKARAAYARDNYVELEFLSSMGDWTKKKCRDSMLESVIYRIAEPKYRPYRLDEASGILGRGIIGKMSGNRFLITAVGKVDSKEGVKIGIDSGYTPFIHLFDNFTFDDGSPIGVPI